MSPIHAKALSLRKAREGAQVSPLSNFLSQWAKRMVFTSKIPENSEPAGKVSHKFRFAVQKEMFYHPCVLYTSAHTCSSMLMPTQKMNFIAFSVSKQFGVSSSNFVMMGNVIPRLDVSYTREAAASEQKIALIRCRNQLESCWIAFFALQPESDEFKAL